MAQPLSRMALSCEKLLDQASNSFADGIKEQNLAIQTLCKQVLHLEVEKQTMTGSCEELEGRIRQDLDRFNTMLGDLRKEITILMREKTALQTSLISVQNRSKDLESALETQTMRSL